MKTPARFLFLAALVSMLTLAVAAPAQENPSSANSDLTDQPSSTVATESAPTPSSDSAPAPAAATSPAAEPAAAEAAQAAPAAAPDDSALRRLDQPAPVATETGKDSENAASADAVEAEASTEPAPAPPAAPDSGRKSRREWRSTRQFDRSSGDARVSFWHDATLEAGERADAVVSIVGSSTSAGRVGDAVVSILGSSTSSGEVGDAVVSVFGSSRVTGGTVGNTVVSVLGNTYVNAKVYGEVVSVLGNVQLGPDAEIHGDLVCVGGRVIRDPAAVVRGKVDNIVIGFNFGGFEWLHAWVSQCLLYGRPLAFGPNLMWAWCLAFAFLAFYLVLALLFPRGIERCAQTLEQRPGFSILTAFLVTLLTPAAGILLAITLIGTPALILAVIVAGLFGKAAMLAWVGRRIAKRFGDGPLSHPVAAVAIGGVIMMLLYTVPVVGFVVSKLASWLGVGVAVYTLILATKRDKAPARVMAAPAIVPTDASTTPVGASPGQSMAAPASDLPAPLGSAVVPPVLPPAISAGTQPRAGFWIRLGASLLDAAIIGVLVNLLPRSSGSNFLLAFAVYCIVLWTAKGTTIGGIVCGLKVVRLDDRPVDWVTAVVRALGGFVSLIPAGLGFVWVAFDDQRQSWHDKIAGTTVVHAPKGVSLV